MSEPIPEEVKIEVWRFAKKLLLVITAVVCFGIFVLWSYQVGTPSSLAQARMDGRVWSDGEIDQARAVTHKQLKALSRILDEADRKGDVALAMQVAIETGPVLRSWNDQPDGVRQWGRDCILAALHVSNGADTVASGQGWNKRQFDQAMADCRP
jgi:hypothetical protein